MADLKDKLATAQSKADLVPDLKAGAVKAQAEIDRLTPVAAQVPDLKAKLATAQSKADLVPDLVEQVQEITGKLDALTNKHTTFKEKAQGVVGEQNQKIAGLIGELEKAKKPVLHQPAPQIPQSNLPTTASRPLEASKTAQEPPKRQEAPVPEKTPREVFLALYEGVKVVLVGMIDGMRLDAAEGRLGLFSSNSRSGPRVQVLCEVPDGKVMPALGQCFDSRAHPGRGGIGD